MLFLFVLQFQYFFWLIIICYFWTFGIVRFYFNMTMILLQIQDLNLSLVKASQFAMGTWIAFKKKFPFWPLTNSMLYAYLTYITPYTQRNDENLIKLDYNFIRAHHSSYMKLGRVCVYYKETLPLTLYNFNYLYEWLYRIRFAISYCLIGHLVNLVTNLKTSSVI